MYYLCVCVYIYPYPHVIFFFSYCFHIFQQGPNPFQCWPPSLAFYQGDFLKDHLKHDSCQVPRPIFSLHWPGTLLGHLLIHVAKPLSSYHSSTPAQKISSSLVS